MTLILSVTDVERILSAPGGRLFEALTDSIEAGYREVADGLVRQHPRIYLRYPEDGARRPPGLFSMSALLPGAGVMGTRLLALTGQGGGGDGLLLLFDHRTARCLAILDDALLHGYRSGAPAAVATRYLARPDSRVVACLGSSGIARGGLTMVCHALPAVQAIRVYSPTEAHRVRFAAEMGRALGLDARAVGSAEEAVAEADVIVTATDADRPVVQDQAIREGTHINLLARNEIEMATFRRSTIVTTSNAHLRELDPPWREPIPEDWIRGELADVVVGRGPTRTSAREITVFVGVAPGAMWDVATAATVYEAALRLGCGTEVEIAARNSIVDQTRA